MTVTGDSATAGAVPPPPAAHPSSPLGPPEHERGWIAAATELAPAFAQRAAELDETAELPAENLRRLHRAGLDTAVLPTAHGGRGMSFRTFGQVLRIVSRACPSTGCLWLMHMGAAAGLVTLGA
jgi:alkylation response protein AidB-like acyl-CoA dehydrogenase